MSKAKSESSGEGEKPVSFEQSLAALEQVVERLEDGELTLSDSLAHYEQGVKHLQQCVQFLDETERKIELLTGVNEDGSARTASFDEGDSTLDEKAAQRSRRRSRPSE